MSLMTLSGPRASVFTFESSAHPCHVLRRLDEQRRRRDALCDVTVLVEGQSFRAHRAVLASCCDYFTHGASSSSSSGTVVSLPQEVTAAGFEPLLKFAYTSKLLFSKDNVLDIRDSASILGFKDLDNACFDFLLPKFFSSNKCSAPFQRKTCCKEKFQKQQSKKDCCTDGDDKLLSEKEVKPVADSPSQQEVAWLGNKLVSSKTGSKSTVGALTSADSKQPEGPNESFTQCPKYRKFQLACGKENCGTEKSLGRSVPLAKDPCDSCSPCFSNVNSKNEIEVESLGRGFSSRNALCKAESDDRRIEKDVGRGVKREDDEEREGNNMKMEEELEHTAEVSSSISSVEGASSGPSAVQGERSSGLILHQCPLKAFGKNSVSLKQDGFVLDASEDKKSKDSGVLELSSIPEKQVVVERKRLNEQERGSMERATAHGETERGSVEREVAEHLAKRLGLDESSSPLVFHDPGVGCSSDSRCKQVQNSSLDWLKHHVDFSGTSASCPFLEDLDGSKGAWKGTGDARLSECEAGKSPGVSSFNSGEDGDSETETEGDSESYTRERARQMQLPFSVDWIVNLGRNDFQQLLKQQSITREQLDFVHDMRRRSKNRIAAQRCRKRKLDCIYNLQCEINKLKTEREKLMMEKSQLSQLKMKTRDSVSTLCQRVCTEANLKPEQLQVLAKYTSPDCPLASFFPHSDSLLTQPAGPREPQASVSACSAGLDKRDTPGEARATLR